MHSCKRASSLCTYGIAVLNESRLLHSMLSNSRIRRRQELWSSYVRTCRGNLPRGSRPLPKRDELNKPYSCYRKCGYSHALNWHQAISNVIRSLSGPAIAEIRVVKSASNDDNGDDADRNDRLQNGRKSHPTIEIFNTTNQITQYKQSKWPPKRITSSQDGWVWTKSPPRATWYDRFHCCTVCTPTNIDARSGKSSLTTASLSKRPTSIFRSPTPVSVDLTCTLSAPDGDQLLTRAFPK